MKLARPQKEVAQQVTAADLNCALIGHELLPPRKVFGRFELADLLLQISGHLMPTATNHANCKCLELQVSGTDHAR